MKPASLRPVAQIFVCCNARAADDPLSSGCGASGPAVYTALRREVGAAGRVREIWVTRTACLGHCPREGCSVAVHPANTQWVNVTATDAPAIARSAVDALPER